MSDTRPVNRRAAYLASLAALAAFVLAGCGANVPPVPSTGTVTQYNPPPAVVPGQQTTATTAAPPPAPVSKALPKLPVLACQKAKPRGNATDYKNLIAIRKIKAAFQAAYSAGVGSDGRYENVSAMVANLRSPDVRFRVAPAAASCRGDSDVAIFDPRSDAGWIIIYLRSDSHAIYRLEGNTHGHGRLVRLDKPTKVMAVSGQ